jgi:hypothetical protein
LEQDINNIDNISDVGESQPIGINSINLNNHVSNDCESPPIETNHTSASHNHDRIIQNQNQSLSVPLAQQSVDGTQRPLSEPLAQQSFNETQMSTDLNTAKDITGGTSLTMIHTLDHDINNVDNNSNDVNESQTIDINSINLNNHASNDCESPSGSGNIATRVRARNEKARKKKVHKKSQNFTARNLDIMSSFASFSYEY